MIRFYAYLLVIVSSMMFVACNKYDGAGDTQTITVSDGMNAVRMAYEYEEKCWSELTDSLYEWSDCNCMLLYFTGSMERALHIKMRSIANDARDLWHEPFISDYDYYPIMLHKDSRDVQGALLIYVLNETANREYNYYSSEEGLRGCGDDEELLHSYRQYAMTYDGYYKEFKVVAASIPVLLDRWYYAYRSFVECVKSHPEVGFTINETMNESRISASFEFMISEWSYFTYGY